MHEWSNKVDITKVTTDSVPLSAEFHGELPIIMNMIKSDLEKSDLETKVCSSIANKHVINKQNTDTSHISSAAVGVGNIVRSRPVGTEHRRLSLLGKPVNFRTARQDARYRKLQAKIYNFLERPKSWQAITYHVFVFASVFACLILSVFSTISEFNYGMDVTESLFYMELCMLFWFFTEYCVRMWSSGCRSRYQTWRGKLLFAKRPFCIVDSIVILASVIVLALGEDRKVFAATALRGLRFFQILRMIRMDRRGGAWKLLASVVWAHRQELFTTVYIGFLGLLFSSFLIYLVEKDDNEKIKSYADALWWGVITLCTVGYGDTVPKTTKGKLIAAFCAVAGISFFALPAGILGSGFALKVQQHQRQKHLIRRRVPAATLIQCLWRCYAADPNSRSEATWKVHSKPLRISPNLETRFKGFSRLTTLKRKPSEKHCSESTSGVSGEMKSDSSPSKTSLCASLSNQLANALSKNSTNTPAVDMQDTDKNVFLNCSLGREDDFFGDNSELPITILQPKHKTAIRFIRRIMFFVARRKFREALRPYDVKDVIEQYSAGHSDMLVRIKILQTRLDQILGPHGGKDRDLCDTKTPLASKIVKIEHMAECIEEKLNLLFEMYKQDRLALISADNSRFPKNINNHKPSNNPTNHDSLATITIQSSLSNNFTTLRDHPIITSNHQHFTPSKSHLSEGFNMPAFTNQITSSIKASAEISADAPNSIIHNKNENNNSSLSFFTFPNAPIISSEMSQLTNTQAVQSLSGVGLDSQLVITSQDIISGNLMSFGDNKLKPESQPLLMTKEVTKMRKSAC